MDGAESFEFEFDEDADFDGMRGTTDRGFAFDGVFGTALPLGTDGSARGSSMSSEAGRFGSIDDGTGGVSSRVEGTQGPARGRSRR